MHKERTLTVLHTLATVMLDRYAGSLPEARDVLTKVTEQSSSVYSPTHILTTRTLCNLAYVRLLESRVDEAERMYRQVLTVIRDTAGPMHADTQTVMNNLGLLLLSHRPSKAEEAVELLRTTAYASETTFPLTHTRHLFSKCHLATCLLKQARDLEEALEILTDTQVVLDKKLGESHIYTLCAGNNLGVACMAVGDFEDALELLEKFLETAEQSVVETGKDGEEGAVEVDRLVGTICTNVALCQESLGRREEAIERLRGLLSRQQNYVRGGGVGRRRSSAGVLGQEGGLTSGRSLAGSVYSTMYYLGRLLGQSDGIKEAEGLYKSILEVSRAKGDIEIDHHSRGLDTITVMNTYGMLLRRDERWDEAVGMFRQAYAALVDSKYGDRHSRTITVLWNLAIALKHCTAPGHGQDQEGNNDARAELVSAEDCYRKLVGLLTNVFGPDHAMTLDGQYELGAVLKQKGKVAEAETVYKRVLFGREKVFGRHNEKTLQAIVTLATFYKSLRRWREAESLFRKALPVYEKLYGVEDPRTLTAVMNLGNACLGKYRDFFKDKAVSNSGKYNRPTSGNKSSSVSPSRPPGASSQNTSPNRGSVKESNGSKPVVPYTAAVGDSLGVDATVASVRNLTGNLQIVAKLSEAESLYRRCLAGRERVLGLSHKDTAIAAYNLGMVYQNKADLILCADTFAKAYQYFQASLGENDQDTTNAKILYNYYNEQCINKHALTSASTSPAKRK